MPCCAGGSPVVIDVSAAGVVDGTTVVIGPPAIAASSGSAVGTPRERVPAQAVEHEQHDGAAPATGAGQPLDRPHAEQRRHHAGDVGARVVRLHAPPSAQA